MKVFTVGLDDKGVKVDQPTKDVEKAVPIVPPSPILVASPEPVKRSRSFKGVFTCCALVVFALLIALTISEIARQRDETFRFKWAELQQRMMGYDLIRAQIQQQQQQQQQQQSFNSRIQSLPILSKSEEMEQHPLVVDERLASNRLNSNSERPTPGPETTTPSVPQTEEPVDIRFAFLRAILEKMRERAQAAGLDGKMHVSLIEVRRPSSESVENDVSNLPSDSESFQDGFGEVAAPHPLTGHVFGNWRDNSNENEQNERLPASDFYGPHWEHPSQFLPEPIRPWNRFPSDASNEGDSAFFPRPWEQSSSNEQEDRPQMKITHHFSQENPSAPSRVVTELYANAAQEMLKNLLLRGAPVMPEAEPLSSMDSTGSSFPRWESDNLPRPWLMNQRREQPFFMPLPGMSRQIDFSVPQPIWQQPPQMMGNPMMGNPMMGNPMMGNPMMGNPMMGNPIAGSPMGNMMGPGPAMPKFWPIPPQVQSQSSFPVQNDDVSSASWGSQMGERMGADLGEQFRENNVAAPARLPFGTQELPQNNVIDVAPVQNDAAQGLQQLPWYVPQGFENERPAWADQERIANDVPVILPHPSAAEQPIDLPDVPESTNSPSISNVNEPIDAPSHLHDGEVQPSVIAWQRSQPDMAIDSVPVATDSPRIRLPERDTFDDVPPRPEHDDPRGSLANDDIDPSQVLFQVDEPHLTP